MKRKKERKNKKRASHLRFTFLIGFVILLSVIFLIIRFGAPTQNIASSPLDPLFKFFTYPTKQSMQIGWFMVFYPTATPAPTKAPVTPTPCPGGTHEQSVAYMPQQPAPTTDNRPPIYITQAKPDPTQKVDPCVSPAP